MPQLKAVTKKEEEEGYRSIHLSLPTALCDEIISEAGFEDRPLANLVRVLLREALAARAAKQSPQ